jgi:hypothetical protein
MVDTISNKSRIPMPFIPTVFWCYSNFYVNILSMATEDKSTDKHPENARFDETKNSFSELLNERAEKESKKGKAIKKTLIFRMC